MTIRGASLTGASATLNGEAVHVTKSTSTNTTLSVTIPLNATTGYVIVSNTNGSSPSPSQLTVLAPKIKSFTASAKVGGTININGSYLAGVTQVSFNGVSTSPLSATNGAVKVVVPAGATTGLLTVFAPSGQAVSTIVFTVKP